MKPTSLFFILLFFVYSRSACAQEFGTTDMSGRFSGSARLVFSGLGGGFASASAGVKARLPFGAEIFAGPVARGGRAAFSAGAEGVLSLAVFNGPLTAEASLERGRSWLPTEGGWFTSPSLALKAPFGRFSKAAGHVSFIYRWAGPSDFAGKGPRVRLGFTL